MGEPRPDRTRNCFIVTVGTSIADKYPPFSRITFINTATNDYKEKLPVENYTPGVINDACDSTIREVSCYIKPRNSARREFGAELNALFRKEPKPGKGDHVTLISTRTPAGAFCSNALQRILQGLNIDCSVIFPKYLGLADDDTFVDQGLAEFLNECYQEIVNKKNGGYTVILCPNGGYKALIPYVTLAGLLEGLEIRYIYDDSDRAMALPHLPIGPNMSAFDNALVTIDDLQSETNIDKKKQKLKRLPKEMRTLFDEEGNFSALGNFLMRVYEAQTEKTPLQRATGNKALLAYLSDDLRAKFHALKELDHLIWKGDRVPEMVEHASRHHTNLFRIAQRILLPCFEKQGENFLSPEELFTLLSALLLHDCGHVMGSVSWPCWNKSGKERLFPGEIREFHHILGYMRLCDGYKNTPSDPIYAALAKTEAWEDIDDPSQMWSDYLQSPATAGLYHRKVMPLKDNESPFTDCGFYCQASGVQPLSLVKVGINGNPIDARKMLLIVALLRLIDSLDNQHSRAGGLEYVNFHISVLDGEIGELMGRIDEFKASSALSGDELTAVETAATMSDVNKNTTQDRNALKALCCQYKEKAYLIRSYFELLLARRFKALQKEHYAKHLPVKRILLLDQHADDQNRFVIDIEIDEDLYRQFPTKKCGIEIPIAEFRQRCLDELQEEYLKIEDILTAAKITIKYGASVS